MNALKMPFDAMGGREDSILWIIVRRTPRLICTLLAGDACRTHAGLHRTVGDVPEGCFVHEKFGEVGALRFVLAPIRRNRDRCAPARLPAFYWSTSAPG